MPTEMIGVNEAAGVLKVSPRQVRNLITGGKLPSQKIGRDHLIRRADLAKLGDRKPGRPPKRTAEPVKSPRRKK